jgi:hypothetical protein
MEGRFAFSWGLTGWVFAAKMGALVGQFGGASNRRELLVAGIGGHQKLSSSNHFHSFVGQQLEIASR